MSAISRPGAFLASKKGNNMYLLAYLVVGALIAAILVASFVGDTFTNLSAYLGA